MPQGSWLGLLTFLILIDDFQPQLLTHKYVDDTTVSEILARNETSRMQSAFDDLITWSDWNYMNINCKKTKEVIYSTSNNSKMVQDRTIFTMADQ